MFIWSGEVYTHIQHWPRVFNLELGQLFCYLAIKQFTKFFFSHPYHLSSQTCKDQGPCVLLVLWEEDLVKALEKRSPRKFYLRNHPLLPVDFLDGKNKTPKRKWTHHFASDGEKSFVTRQQILQLLESEEPGGTLCPSHLQASGSPRTALILSRRQHFIGFPHCPISTFPYVK